MPFLLRSTRPCLRHISRPRLSPSAAFLNYPTSRSFQSPAQQPNGPPDFAFAFDIDGVLMHGATPIPVATPALQLLQKNRIEFLLLTNGGGKHESARVSELSRKLHVPIAVEQFVQSHTPFKQLAEQKLYKTVLIVGGEHGKCRSVAKAYGFENVVLPGDVLVAFPPLSPFSDVEVHRSYAEPLPEERTKVDAVFVFNDPRDWALDTQLMLDVLVSEDGVLGTKRGDLKTNAGEVKKGHVPLYFSNPDLLWANEYHLPRLGQGGFRAAFEGVWRNIVGDGLELKSTIIGKPHAPTYQYAETVLTNWHRSRFTSPAADISHLPPKPSGNDLKTVYMVGDNPASDIAGANNFKSPLGIEWVSVLVKTGVYRPGDSDNRAKVVVDNVLEGVRWAIEREEEKRRRRVCA
ncbi:hypothetical protein RUND412_009439 [Rhizina undulata]